VQTDASLRARLSRSLTAGVLGPLLVFVAALAIYLPTASTDLIHVDVASSALGGFQIATTGEPWLDGEDLSDFPVTFGVPLWTGEAANGHTVVMRSPGPVIAAIPGYYLSNSAPGLSNFEIAPQAWTAAVLAAAALALMFLALRSLGSRRAAVVVAILGLATPMWSVDADQLWTHTITTLGLAGMAWSASKERWWLVGVFGGIGLWGRLHVTLIVALLGLGLAIWRRRPSIAVKVGLPSAAFLGLASLWGHWMYGGWSPAGGYAVTAIASTAAEPGGNGTGVGFTNQLGLWFALDRGVLIWTPLILVMLPALVRSWRSIPDWSRLLLVGGLGYMLVQGRLNPFHGGDGYWGYRLGLEFLICATPALAFASTALRKWEWVIIPPLVGAQFAAISIGAITEATYLLTDQMWSHNSFVEALKARPGTWVWLILAVGVGVAVSMRGIRQHGLQPASAA
jgi:hypothetical protein